MLLALFCTQAVFAQTTVTGQVVDENAEPLIGASVQLKGTSTGMPTDINGNFKVDAKSGQTLVVSYIGYDTREVKVPASGSMKIVLKASESSLDGVVVVGVLMKKSDLTGAVSHVDADVLTEKPVTTINEALQGRVAGVNITKGITPSDDSSIKIRGTNTINSGSSPIYVVDGLVMDNQFGFFNSININDVESIEVLKDASATALYGSRGANGVIVVTTKKARKGEGISELRRLGELLYHGPPPRDHGTHSRHSSCAPRPFANGYAFNNPNARLRRSRLTGTRDHGL